MREPKTLTKATFVDLRTMLSLGEFDEPELLEPRFLVREEYSELYEYLDRGSPLSKHVLLVGQPGIGKTMFLTYCLLKRLIDRRPTIFAPSAGIRFMFLDTGVYFIPHDFYDYDDPLVDTQYEDSLVLQDLNESQLKPQQFKDWRVLVASPPELDRYKAWGKYKQPKYFAMKTWTWDEIFLARGMGVRSRSDDEWRIAYLKYGGSARLLYTGDVYAERQISLAITECNDIRTLFPLISLGFKNHTSHALIQMNPKVEKDMKVNREIMSGQITSGYILEKLLERNMQELVNTIADTFHMLFSNDVTRSASRILFERAAHRHLLASCTVPFYIWPLSGQSGPVQLNLQHVQETRSFTPLGIRPFQELDPRYYYLPLINNFAGIDSFALEVDHSHLPVSVVLFQFATSLNHPVKTNFFQKLWNKHQLASNMVKWKLVFIVPQAMQAKYVAQPLKPTTAAKDWGDRVEQYVLGVDT